MPTAFGYNGKRLRKDKQRCAHSGCQIHVYSEKRYCSDHAKFCPDCDKGISPAATRCASCATKAYHKSLTPDQKKEYCDSMKKAARYGDRSAKDEILSMMQDYNEQEYSGFGEIEAAKKRGDAMRMELDLRKMAGL